MDERIGGLTGRAESGDGAGHGELRRAEAVDEVAATHLAALFEHLEDAVHVGEPAGESLGEHGFTGDDAVPLDELECLRVRRLGRMRGGFEQRRDQAPPTLPRGRTDPVEATGSWTAAPAPGGRAGLRAAGRGASDHGAEWCERVVGDLAGPHQVPERGEDLGILCAGGRSAELVPEAGAALGEQRANRVVDRALGCIVAVPPGSEERELVGKHETHPAVVGADGARADPHEFTCRAELVEHRGSVRRDAGQQDVGLDGRRDESGAREDAERLDECVDPSSLGRDVVPCREEPGERLLLDRFDLATESGARSSAELAEHVDVAVLARDALGPELADDEPFVTFECGERARDAFGRRAEAAGDVGGDERTVRAGEATHQLFERAGDRGGERRGKSERDRAPESVPIAGGVLGGGVPGLAGDPDLDRPLLLDQLPDPRRTSRV